MFLEFFFPFISMKLTGIPRWIQGKTRARFEELRSDIIQCLAMVEALIDFGEGEDIEEGVYYQGNLSLSPAYPSFPVHPSKSALVKAQSIIQTIQTHLSDSRRGEILRSGIRLAIFGPPNAGKSSLLNFLGMLGMGPTLK